MLELSADLRLEGEAAQQIGVAVVLPAQHLEGHHAP
jgi:hypothetical protein